jgi:membrane protein implicated in regulation of membrane protease activity
VKIDDSLWLAISEDRTALPAGCTAEVIAFNGATLTIRDVNDETAAER